MIATDIMMKNKMLNFLKKNKIPIVLLLIILSIMALIIIMSMKDEDEKPYSIHTRPSEESETYLKLISTTPESGTSATDGSFNIEMLFDQNIDLNTLKITVKPELSLAIKNEREKNILDIFPNKIIWQEGKEYQITIYELKSDLGHSIEKSINFIYKYEPPEFMEAGESWMTGEENLRDMPKLNVLPN
jgi:hypothetical protein